MARVIKSNGESLPAVVVSQVPPEVRVGPGPRDTRVDYGSVSFKCEPGLDLMAPYTFVLDGGAQFKMRLRAVRQSLVSGELSTYDGDFIDGPKLI